MLRTSSCATSKRFSNWMKDLTIDSKKNSFDTLSSVKKKKFTRPISSYIVVGERLYGEMKDVSAIKKKLRYHIYVWWLVELSRQNWKSKTTLFVPSYAATQDFECHVIVESFCRRDSGQDFVCKFHCAIVCTELQWLIVRINRSISANERAKARKPGKEEKYLR